MISDASVPGSMLPDPEPSPWRKVTAIVRRALLESVERRLQELRVPGITVTRVKGFGEYRDFFTPDWMGEHVRLEMFLPGALVDRVVRGIVETAQTGAVGDGIVVVLPVETCHRIRTGELLSAEG